MAYTIQRGDTLSGLAKKFGTTVADLAKLNNIADVNKIYAGNTLKLPEAPKAPTAPTALTTPGAAGGGSAMDDAAGKLQQNGYQSQYSDQLKGLLDKVLNRSDFSYDMNADPLYQQYKDKYTALGQTAMKDTVGNAASLTGGYASSAATTAGSQAYQSYLNQLNNVVPELYNAAYSRYQNEGNALYDQISMLNGLDTADYSKYRDNVGDQQWKENFLYNQAQDKIDNDYRQNAFEYQQSQDAVSNNQWEKNYAAQTAAKQSESTSSAYPSSYKNALSRVTKMVDSGDFDKGAAMLKELIVNGGEDLTEAQVRLMCMEAGIAYSFMRDVVAKDLDPTKMVG